MKSRVFMSTRLKMSEKWKILILFLQGGASQQFAMIPMNLMKNGIEHGSGGRIHCSYAQNPLYTEILIWDEGEGFAAEDILHLFERFYCGKNAGEGSLGIGLALAKEIIESQNGTIQARNRPEGGALFEIHFYCH